ncbi:MAG: beta strand repeat-containing protein [Chthoniobacterales bacterium]
MKVSNNPIERAALLLLALALLFQTSALAGSATWNIAPSSGDWNTPSNWIPGTVPNGPGDTATFGPTLVSDVSISANTEVNGISFNLNDNNYLITATPTFTLTISGTGITNSGNPVNFAAGVNGAGAFDAITFSNNASAGSSINISNSGATVFAATGGLTQFLNASTAGSAAIYNNAGTVNGAGGGYAEFFNTSNASSAAITNNGGAVSGAFQGYTFFNDGSSAGSATIINNSAVSGATAGVTTFFNTSTAASANITNNEGAVAGLTRFFDSATAGSSTINNNGGQTDFHGNSTAGSATIIDNPAGNQNNGGLTRFLDSASAGTAIITNNGNGSSTETSATQFLNNSTAASATITNNGGNGGTGASTTFQSTSTAGNAAITNNGGTLNGATGGRTTFQDSSSAGSATITTNGSTAFEALGGLTIFANTSNAGNAILITNAPDTSTHGFTGATLFQDSADGGTARAITSGTFDISGLTSGGMGIGSIEGSGFYSLGANTLTTGKNNLSTTLSGGIHDSGSLIKVGTGTFTLSGANFYTGTTTINTGELDVDGSTMSNTFVNAGTLGGTGTISGSVTVGTGSGSGAVISPGHSIGTLTIANGLALNSDATYKFELNSTTAIADKLIANGVTISGAHFSFTDLGSGALAPGTTFVIIDNNSTSAINGVFANLADGGTFSSNGNTYLASYEGSTGDDLTLTVVVPEPGAAVLVLLGCGLFLVRRRTWRAFSTRA